MTSRVRLVKMVVQPVVVVDDGETLREVKVDPIHVDPADWPAFSGERWPEMVAEQEAALNPVGDDL